jgi:hypothetical protein
MQFLERENKFWKEKLLSKILNSTREMDFLLLELARGMEKQSFWSLNVQFTVIIITDLRKNTR